MANKESERRNHTEPIVRQQESALVFPSPFMRVDTVAHMWSDIEVRYSHKYPVPGTSWADLRSPRTSAIVRLEQRGGSCEPRLNPHKSITKSRSDVGFFNWIPPDCPIWCYSDDVRILRDIHLSFDVSTVSKILGNPADMSRVSEPHLMVYDARVKACAHLLADACQSDLKYDRLYGESLTTAMVAALFGALRTDNGRRMIGGLAPWQLRLAKEYLEQDASGKVSLSELAELTGLSRSRLARGFKTSTGLAPYNWALHARIEKAKESLKGLENSIADTALALGFADQSHFTKVFRRVVGTTPAEWRSRRRRSRIV
jgi:AraC family transcriptional regulator